MEVFLLSSLGLLILFRRRFLFILIFFSFMFCSNVWVAEYEGHRWYESDFYKFMPKHEWLSVSDVKQKNNIFTNFLKQNVAAYNALALGLNYSFEVEKKVQARYKMLLVNEYYMRHFLGSLIPYSAITFCKENLKKEVFAKHILLPFGSENQKDSVLALSFAIKDSILAGFPFSDFALNYSADPSVGVNSGGLGWVQVGRTVPEFQTALFSLCLGCVDVVETEFGYHVVGVDSLRASVYAEMDNALYEDFVFRFSSAYIKEDLAVVAASHDTMLVEGANIVFNDASLSAVLESLDLDLKLKSGKRSNVDILSNLKTSPGILVSYDSHFLSGAWFANKIENTLHRPSFYSTLKEIKADFLMVLLRDIVYNKALSLGLNKSFSFVSQYEPVKVGIYEKAFYRWLSDGVVSPTKNEVSEYFNKNYESGSLDKAYKSIEAILIQQKQKKSKLLYENSIINRENIIVNEEWFNE